MVGNHLEGRGLGIDIHGARLLDRALGGGHEVLEEINVIVRRHALQNGGKTLKAHARVNVRTGEPVHLAARIAVELRKDEVPDLHVPVAVLIGAPRRAALDGRAAVIEDFRARTAGARVAHHPEVVGHVARTLVVADAHDALGGHADLLVPDVVRLVVLLVHGHPEPLGRQVVNRREEFPGPADGLTLEVVAEAEVPEHLEERVMAGRVADIVEVIVLAARANALLRGRCPVQRAVQAKEVRLELVHACVRKEQRRVIVRNHGARLDERVALALKELQIGRANLGGGHVGIGSHNFLVLASGRRCGQPDNAKKARGLPLLSGRKPAKRYSVRADFTTAAPSPLTFPWRAAIRRARQPSDARDRSRAPDPNTRP